MGVPRFLEALKPYRVFESLRGKDVVIDGPALAHYLYYSLLKSKPSALNFHEADPSYREVGERVLAWLYGLRGSGAHVQRIFFDGFLPLSKVPVRLRRRVKHTERLLSYHKQFSSGVPYEISRAQLKECENVDFPFEHDIVGPRLFQLPSQSFLVPSVIEAISTSSYHKDIIEVVAGEADAFCARYLKQHGGVVFTQDSDLLVHDLGLNGAVSLFEDVEVSFEQGSKDLYSHMYYPAPMSERFGLPKSHGLLALAFEFVREHGLPLEKKIERAKQLHSLTLHPELYNEFAEQYLSDNLASGDEKVLNSETSQCYNGFQTTRNSHPNGIQTPQTTLPNTQNLKLDPRVSEYVLQFLPTTAPSNQPPQEPGLKNEKPFFLPLLVDSPLRTNAYETSTSIRELAYTLMNLTIPPSEQCTIVHEHSRQTNSLKGRPTHLLNLSEVPDVCTSIIHLLEQIKSHLPTLSPTEQWIAISIHQDLQHSLLTSRPPLSLTIAQPLKTNSPSASNTLSWDVIHFLAQFHGSFYSFRTFKQISDFLISSELFASSLPEEVLKLNEKLNELPRLSELPNIEYAFSVFPKLDIGEMVRVSCGILGVGEDMFEMFKARGMEGEEERVKGMVLNGGKKFSSNPFEVLDVE